VSFTEDRVQVRPVDGHSFAVGSRPTGSVQGGGRHWIANSGDGTVSHLTREEANAGAVTTAETIDVGGTPSILEFRGDRLWVLTNNAVVLYDPATGEISSNTLGTADDTYLASWAFLDDGSAWISDTRGDRLVEVDASGVPTERAITLERGAAPTGVLLTSSGELWVALSGLESVARVDVGAGAGNEVVGEISVGSLPRLIRAGPDDLVYVQNFGDGTVSVVDPATAEVHSTLTAP
jgi:YVTN family beta-propeller protein